MMPIFDKLTKEQVEEIRRGIEAERKKANSQREKKERETAQDGEDKKRSDPMR